MPKNSAKSLTCFFWNLGAARALPVGAGGEAEVSLFVVVNAVIMRSFDKPLALWLPPRKAFPQHAPDIVDDDAAFG